MLLIVVISSLTISLSVNALTWNLYCVYLCIVRERQWQKPLCHLLYGIGLVIFQAHGVMEVPNGTSSHEYKQIKHKHVYFVYVSIKYIRGRSSMFIRTLILKHLKWKLRQCVSPPVCHGNLFPLSSWSTIQHWQKMDHYPTMQVWHITRWNKHFSQMIIHIIT